MKYHLCSLRAESCRIEMAAEAAGCGLECVLHCSLPIALWGSKFTFAPRALHEPKQSTSQPPSQGGSVGVDSLQQRASGGFWLWCSSQACLELEHSGPGRKPMFCRGSTKGQSPCRSWVPRLSPAHLHAQGAHRALLHSQSLCWGEFPDLDIS